MNSEHSNQNSEHSNGEEFIEVNGEKITLDELKKGYLRQSDYTKKMQAMKSEKPESNEDPEDVQKAIKLLKENGMLTREDYENEKKLDKLFSSIPELSEKRKIIEDLSKSQNKSAEDVIVEYGLVDKARLDQINTSVMGDSLPKEINKKSISDMTDKEYEEWKKTNIKQNNFI